MRIALVSSLVRQNGGNGEDLAVMDQAELLAAAGHDVLLLTRSTDALRGSGTYVPTAAFTVATGYGPSPLRQLEEFAPDVVHVHNTYPNYGRAWAADLEAPLVVTLHSFRFFCARATFFRDGRICTSCVSQPLSAVRHGCYESALRSLPYSLAGLRRARDPLLSSADQVIVLNPRMREYLVDAGFDEAKVVQGFNTVPAVPPVSSSQEAGPTVPAGGTSLGAGIADDGTRRAWLFVGRLIEEKGILRLLETWPQGEPLDVIGDGPVAARARALAGPDVRLLGRLNRSELRGAMAGALGLIIPSLWFEGMPLVYLEALEAGLPVIAHDPNSAAALIRDDGTGIATTWDEPLAATLGRAREDFPALRGHCAQVFGTRYSPQAYVAHLEAVYAAATAGRTRTAGRGSA